MSQAGLMQTPKLHLHIPISCVALYILSQLGDGRRLMMPLDVLPPDSRRSFRGGLAC